MMTVDEVLAAIPEGPYSWTMSLIQYELGKYDVQKNAPHATDLCAAFTVLMRASMPGGLDHDLIHARSEGIEDGAQEERQRVLGIIEGMEKDADMSFDARSHPWVAGQGEGKLEALRELRQRIEEGR